jgi:RNA polymerase sigma-70 factor (ECF subfamily)
MEFEKILELLQSKEHPMKEKGANELYKKLYQPLMGFYRQKRLNKFESEEVILSSLLKICTKIDTVKEPKKFRAWCWTIARNTLMDHFRKYKKYENDIAEIGIDKDGAEYSRLDKIKIVTRVNKETEKEDTDQCVQLGLQEFAKAMPERAFVIQMKLENLTNLQISERIGKTLAATKEYVSQSYKKLGPFIKHCEEGSE